MELKVKRFIAGCTCKIIAPVNNKKGMEMVQVAILVAIAIAIGLIFKSSITEFVNKIFSNLDAANF